MTSVRNPKLEQSSEPKQICFNVVLERLVLFGLVPVSTLTMVAFILALILLYKLVFRPILFQHLGLLAVKEKPKIALITNEISEKYSEQRPRRSSRKSFHPNGSNESLLEPSRSSEAFIKERLSR